MHLLILAGFGLGCLAVLWAAQTLALWSVGDRRPWVLPFRHDSESPTVRWSLKAALQGAILTTLVLYPWTIGENPLAYHAWLTSPQWTTLLTTAGLTLAVFGTHQAINVTAGWVRLIQKYPAKKTARKLARSFLTPLPLAVVEEALFRGVVLRQLLEACPAGWAGMAAAMGLSAALFALVHFLRPQKRTLLPAVGLFVFGLVLGTAYVAGGNSCWLPIGIHAAGVWVIQVLRPFVEYRGPAWVIGYPSYPICGVPGLAALAILTALVVASVGV